MKAWIVMGAGALMLAARRRSRSRIERPRVAHAWRSASGCPARPMPVSAAQCLSCISGRSSTTTTRTIRPGNRCRPDDGKP